MILYQKRKDISQRKVIWRKNKRNWKENRLEKTHKRWSDHIINWRKNHNKQEGKSTNYLLLEINKKLSFQIPKFVFKEDINDPTVERIDINFFIKFNLSDEKFDKNKQANWKKRDKYKLEVENWK